MKHISTLLLILLPFISFSQTINITVDPTVAVKYISPWIYGRNNSISDDPSNPTSAAQWQLYNDAGLRMYRENGGNNATKYNWRKKLSSHPDWYNNVYSHDWDYSAASLLSHTINTQGLYAFQLLGKVASNKTHNFDDYHYTLANGYINMDKNWAGGGGPAPYGNGGNGNPALYLQDWPADSTTAILNHWFEHASLGFDANRLMYWNMDNEPEIWQSTHDDIASSAITAEMYMQKYFAVAKAARARVPNIKLIGPVSPNEWQWYTWNNNKITYNGHSYSWLEYFIKRISEEQLATGIRLLDVIDLHFYPGTASDPDQTLQLHKVFFDTLYNWPGANGVKVTGASGWTTSITKEYIFTRCNKWLNQYIGSNHNVSFSISEYGTIANSGSEDPNIIACWYASHLGTFANNGVELFTPWDWYKGQWEVMHLFSNKFGIFSNQAVSSNEDTLSAYSSLSLNGDSLIIAIVNRDRNNSRTADINILNFVPSQSSVNGYQLANLPGTETFVSKSTNALQTIPCTLSGNNLSLSVPKLSVTLIQIPTSQALTVPAVPVANLTVAGINNANTKTVHLFPNPSNGSLYIMPEKPGDYSITILDMLGKMMGKWNLNGNAQIDISNFVNGSYVLQMFQNDQFITRKIVKE
jgi:hypothetical protein